MTNDCFDASAIKIMSTDVHRYNHIVFDVKHSAQIRFNFHRVNGAAVPGGEPVYFVSTQTPLEGIFLENLPCPPGRILLTG